MVDRLPDRLWLPRSVAPLKKSRTVKDVISLLSRMLMARVVQTRPPNTKTGAGDRRLDQTSRSNNPDIAVVVEKILWQRLRVGGCLDPPQNRACCDESP